MPPPKSSPASPPDASEFPVRFVPGVGPKIAELLAQKGIQTAKDLLYFFPFKYLDRRSLDRIGSLAAGQRTIVGKVLSLGMFYLGRSRRRIFEMMVGDETGAVSLKWFHFYPQQMQARFQKGTVLMVSGEVTLFRGDPQFVHPQLQVLDADLMEEAKAPGIVPTYSQIPGLGQKGLRRMMQNCLERMELKDPLPEALLDRHQFPSKRRSLEELHFPPPELSLQQLNEARSPAHCREIFEEFFFMEIGLALKRRQTKREEGIAFAWKPEQVREQLHQLPFELTAAQKRALLEILKDMERPVPMNRLIQGDVGCGKTVVAFLAASIAIYNGYQVALMAPTEILAEQHFQNAQKLLASMKIPIALLTGSIPAAEKTKTQSRIRRGIYPLVIGTHAVISDGVEFKNLGLAIIDEQHRFGVLQRKALRAKGMPDVLVMTATPIPRTLAMTVYGDLDGSIINEMPPGRQPIRTEILESKDRRGLYNRIAATLDRGEQGYIVYPLVEESEKLALKDATKMFAELKKVFPDRHLALLHGKVATEAKAKAFAGFKAGAIGLLVCTTVVEVGVDVPNATLMVIEHADRFGLSQLHQLRGRVGRGTKPSYCLLVSGYTKSEVAYRRLQVMCQTQDGFKIAEEDLKIRGPGDFLGTRQSGLPEFRLANLLRDTAILQEARREAFALVDQDPELTAHPALRDELMRNWREKLALAEIA